MRVSQSRVRSTDFDFDLTKLFPAQSQIASSNGPISVPKAAGWSLSMSISPSTIAVHDGHDDFRLGFRLHAIPRIAVHRRP
jgi:hypothetical protein